MIWQERLLQLWVFQYLHGYTGLHATFYLSKSKTKVSLPTLIQCTVQAAKTRHLWRFLLCFASRRTSILPATCLDLVPAENMSVRTTLGVTITRDGEFIRSHFESFENDDFFPSESLQDKLSRISYPACFTNQECAIWQFPVFSGRSHRLFHLSRLHNTETGAVLLPGVSSRIPWYNYFVGINLVLNRWTSLAICSPVLPARVARVFCWIPQGEIRGLMCKHEPQKNWETALKRRLIGLFQSPTNTFQLSTNAGSMPRLMQNIKKTKNRLVSPPNRTA